MVVLLHVNPKIKMTKTIEKPIIDLNNALTWPEGTPAVSMDVRLSKENYQPRKSRIDFDIAKYMELLDKKRVKPQKRAKLRVNIVDDDRNDLPRPKGLMNISKRTAGLYEGGLAQVSLESNERREHNNDLADTNRTLLHETKHFLQDRGGRGLSKREQLAKYYITKYIIPLGLIASTPYLEKYAGANIDWATWGSALGSHLYARSMTMYRFHPREVTARRFANRYMEKYGDIITTSPLTKNTSGSTTD